GAMRRRGVTSTADPSVTAVITAKTAPGPEIASKAPATAGAASVPMLSFQPETTVEAVSSSGRRARYGTSADWAGRVIVRAPAAHSDELNPNRASCRRRRSGFPPTAEKTRRSGAIPVAATPGQGFTLRAR